MKSKKNNLYHAHDADMIKYHYINMIISVFVLILKPFRDKRLWVFGCWDGNRYDDNARYFFEYINQYHPDIRTVWITRSPSVVNIIEEKGYNVLLADSVQAKKTMLKAGAAFYTNSLYDFYKICYLRGAVIFNICHGSGGSKVQIHAYNRHKKGSMRYYLKNILTFLEHTVFGWFYFDYVTAPSEFCGRAKRIAYSLKNMDKVVACGFPRNDIFFDNVNYKKKLGLNEEIKYILYMPTFRTYENSIINDFIASINSNTKLVDELEKNNYKIIVKPHNAEKNIAYCNNDIICVLDSNKVNSTQELLAATDIMITDYSSCCTDYALKHKPIIFYAPDYQCYAEKCGLTDYWKSLLDRFACTDAQQLSQYLLSTIKDNTKENKLTEEINSKYEGKKLGPGETYCSRLYEFAVKKI
jgi:CDP-glycerol glycerophosphotransferase (TagB/SpsB family)